MRQVGVWLLRVLLMGVAMALVMVLASTCTPYVQRAPAEYTLRVTNSSQSQYAVRYHGFRVATLSPRETRCVSLPYEPTLDDTLQLGPGGGRPFDSWPFPGSPTNGWSMDINGTINVPVRLADRCWRR